MNALYDTIGNGYAQRRKPDHRLARAIHGALGAATRVVNIGAGAGSYEPRDRPVAALEPSAAMIRQRPAGSAPAFQGIAENLPFADRAFDAAMAVLTVHHWSDLAAGLREMQRVSRDRVVILTFDPYSPYFWLIDYFPQIVEIDRRTMPSLDVFEPILGPVTVDRVMIPHDCTDGFLGAYWRRPHAYLDPNVRSAISLFSMLGDTAGPLEQLQQDLSSGRWQDRYGYLLREEALDVGYRLIVADRG